MKGIQHQLLGHAWRKADTATRAGVDNVEICPSIEKAKERIEKGFDAAVGARDLREDVVDIGRRHR